MNRKKVKSESDLNKKMNANIKQNDFSSYHEIDIEKELLNYYSSNTTQEIHLCFGATSTLMASVEECRQIRVSRKKQVANDRATTIIRIKK